jgi:predicted O-methyltransferase YrrM
MEIDEERFQVYLECLPDDLPDHLKDLEIKAKKNRIPIIRKDSQKLIKFMLRLKRPAHILEVGTATGFSSLIMAQYSPKKADIFTIEKDHERAEEAQENFNLYDKENKIRLEEGDAAEILERLAADPTKKKYYDFIFMDAAKGQYINFLPYIRVLLRGRGILITDNILQEGSLLDSRYMVPRRDRTIHARMREYVDALMKDKHMDTVLLSAGDGMTLSVRKG